MFFRLLSFAAPTQLDLPSQLLKKAVYERDASAQFFMAELAEEQEEPRRLDDRLVVASERFTCCRGDTL